MWISLVELFRFIVHVNKWISATVFFSHRSRSLSLASSRDPRNQHWWLITEPCDIRPKTLRILIVSKIFKLYPIRAVSTRTLTLIWMQWRMFGASAWMLNAHATCNRPRNTWQTLQSKKKTTLFLFTSMNVHDCVCERQWRSQEGPLGGCWVRRSIFRETFSIGSRMWPHSWIPSITHSGKQEKSVSREGSAVIYDALLVWTDSKVPKGLLSTSPTTAPSKEIVKYVSQSRIGHNGCK